MKAIIAGIMITMAFLSMAFATAMTNSAAVAQNATSTPTTTSSSIQGGFANIQTVQDEKHIAITITKAGEPPQGPVIVIPPAPGEKNGTIVTPGNTTTANQTSGGNVTVIDQKGNITEVPNGNVTQVNNGTVVIAPPNQNVTVTPGNVTVIDPPVQQPPVPTCDCQNQKANVTQPNPLPPQPAVNNSNTTPPLIPNNQTGSNQTSNNKTG